MSRVGGWFIWALRDAAASQGHHNSAIAADAYYRGLAREISDACNSGVLDCLPMQSKLIPQINTDDLWHIADSVIFLTRSLLSFRGFAAELMVMHFLIYLLSCLQFLLNFDDLIQGQPGHFSISIKRCACIFIACQLAAFSETVNLN